MGLDPKPKKQPYYCPKCGNYYYHMEAGVYFTECPDCDKPLASDELIDENKRLTAENKHNAEMSRCWKANAEALADVANKAEARVEELEGALQEIADSGVAINSNFNWIATLAKQALATTEKESK